jgi:hypothetical protein
VTDSIDGDKLRLPTVLPIGSTDGLAPTPDEGASPATIPADGSTSHALPADDPLVVMQKEFEKQLDEKTYEKLRNAGFSITSRLQARGIFDVSGEDFANDVLRRTYAGIVTWHHERENVTLFKHARAVMWQDFRALVRKRAGEIGARSGPGSSPAIETPTEPGQCAADGADGASNEDDGGPDYDDASDATHDAAMRGNAEIPSEARSNSPRLPDVDQLAGDHDPVRQMEQRSLIRWIEDALFRLAAMSADEDLRTALVALFQGARGEQDVIAMTDMDAPRARRAWRMVRRLITEIPDDVRAEAHELM